MVVPFFAKRTNAVDGVGFIKNLAQFVAANPFGADIKEPLKVILAPVVLVQSKPWLVFEAVIIPLMVTAPVVALEMPGAFTAKTEPVIFNVPPWPFLIPTPLAEDPAVILPVTIIAPVEALKTPYGAIDPGPPVMFPVAFIVPTPVLFAP